jgi:hypothetical protein
MKILNYLIVSFLFSVKHVLASECTCKGADSCIVKYVDGNITTNEACHAYCESDKGCPGGTYEFSEAACISGNTLLYSCTKKDYVSARDVSIGEKVRAVAGGTGESVCSEVYHVYRHDDQDTKTGIFAAVAITTTDGNVLEVAPKHLVYVGESFKSRRAVLASNIVPGDVLVSANGPAVVLSVKPVPVTDLVNILTYEPALQVIGNGKQNSVIISAYSYNETSYHYLFATPLRFWYYAFGNRFESSQLSAMKKADEYIVQPLLLWSAIDLNHRK